jgi:sigma-54 dependent transcriptional regulator, acetoin dehydrogenase operon transcriptional activator AcoR
LKKEPWLLLEQIICDSKNLLRILDNLREGVVAHDLNRRIFFFNREAEKITGYSRDEVLGKDCHEAFGHPLCGESCHFCNATHPDLADEKYTMNLTTKAGEIRRVDMTITTISKEDGKPLGVLATFADLTDILQLKIEARKLTRFSDIIGQDEKIQRIFQQIRDVAEFDYPVHIYGATGTGKELVATAIHRESHRRNGPFVPINCGALPEGLIESELFGHVKGAFSGAIRDKKGRFELADGGTIFLDEIAELSKPMQVKLLRFLQEGTFEQVGGEKTISVDVRVASATNKDLKKEIQRNNFREDLFYRLNVIPILLPTLKERRNDIPLLVDHFLEKAAERYNREKLKISKEALVLSMDYPWPGNVRELQNAVQFAIVKCSDNTIKPQDLPLELRDTFECRPKRGRTRKLDLIAVAAALKEAGGNRSKAARFLGVGRATLYRFLKDHPHELR